MNGYPLNASGESFGAVQPGLAEPDLIKAFGVDRVVGYVRRTDLQEPQPESPWIAANTQARDRDIPLFASDGMTAISKFTITGFRADDRRCASRYYS